MEKMSIVRSESINFYKYLCKKIGSVEVVRFRRLAFTIMDIGLDGLITSGSKAEGLDLNGSDFDVMIIDSNFKVFQSVTELPSHCYAYPLIMNTEETHPCFTQLQFLVNDIEIIPKMLEKNHQGRMVSSELYKLCYKKFAAVEFPALFFGKIHGPCISDRDDTLDIAWCLKCDKWICQANPWIRRPRTAWPSQKIISKIVSSGVLFVPIGYKGSINEHLEWRISFSLAEKFLIFSFSHTQLLCYAMLKILVKEIIDKYEELKGLLCSYFLKTLMFWIIEETGQLLWRPDNMIPCFMACLQRLLYCVKYSILSHYFISDNNLFYLRFNTNNEEQLITILTNIYEQGVYCFESSETLHDVQNQSHESTESVIFKFVQQIMPTFCSIRTTCPSAENNQVLRLFYNFVHISRTALSRVSFAFQISEACSNVPEVTQYAFSSGNKQHYSKYKHDLSHLVIGLYSDALSGFLKLASFFYVHKNYEASLTMITHALEICTDEKTYTVFLANKLTFNPISKHVSNLMKKEKLHTMIKSLTMFPLKFRLKSSLIPQELQEDVSRLHTRFHPLPFAHFLNFLCYYHLHDMSSSRQSLQRLTRLVQWILSEKGVNILIEPESANAIICCGIAYQLMGESNIARHAFHEAAKIDRYNLTSAGTRLHCMTS